VQPVRRDVEPEAKESAEMPGLPEAESRVRRAPGTVILCVALVFAAGAGTGFMAAKRTPASDVDAKVATSAAGGAGLRLDYDLKQRPAAAQRRKP